MTKLDIALVRDITAPANDADQIARRLERERTNHELHRASMTCRDFATAVRHALSGLSVRKYRAAIINPPHRRSAIVSTP
jgi:hypothetical protein